MDPHAKNRPSLPSIHYLTSDPAAKEKEGTFDRPPATMPPSNVMHAPSPYPTGPAPSYSAQRQPHSLPKPGPESGYRPQESRDAAAPATYFLPSIQEALGGKPGPPPFPSDQKDTALAQLVHVASTMASPRTATSAPALHPYTPTHQNFPPRDQIRQSRPEQSDPRRDDHGHVQPPYPRQSPTEVQPRQRLSQSSADSSSAYNPSPARSRQPSQFQFGYAAAPPPTSAAGPAAQYSAPAIYAPSQAWPGPAPAPVPAPAPQHHRPAQPYSETVKRQFEMYDIETAINDIGEHGLAMHDFRRQYGARIHQAQRSGMEPGSIPPSTEVDDLINKNRQNGDTLSRLRDLVHSQEVAHIQERRSRAEEVERNDSIYAADEGKGGFAGADAKKRRGRNAAPGRCHACNRAETPEWRRGPDGARTLCNACGLHYAKLNRKKEGNKMALNSSNLRPKMGDDSDA